MSVSIHAGVASTTPRPSGGSSVRAAMRNRIVDILGVSPAAMYSTRRLTDSHTGPCLRVRRSSDNIETDVGFLSNGDLNIYAMMNHVGAENGLLLSDQADLWTMVGGITAAANAAYAPDSTRSMGMLVSGGPGSRATRAYTTVSGTTYTISCFFKAGTGNAGLSWSDGGGGGVTHIKADLAAGTISATFGAPVASGIQNIGNGIYRVWFTQVSPAVTARIIEAEVWDGSADNFNYPSSAAGKNCYAWGLQINTGATLAEYCRTDAAPTVSGSGFIVKWYDQSGRNNDLAQATPANQPRIVNAGVIDRIATTANKPGIRTDGISQLLITPGFSAAQPYSRSSVIQFLNPAAGANARVLGNGADLNGDLHLSAAGSLSMLAGGAAQAVKTGLVANDKATLLEIYNGASSSLSYNGVVTAAAATPGAAGCTGLTVGGQFNNLLWNSNIYGDLIVFTNALSTGDRQTLEADQKAYWGTP